MAATEIKLDKIRLDGGTQPRQQIDDEIVAEYAERMEEGDKFPPVVGFYDGTDYWLADGFHRTYAARKACFKTIAMLVKQGTQRDAQWYSFGANTDHGLRRDAADARRAIEKILLDDEWKKTPQTKIAEHVGVSQGYVSQIKSSLINTNKLPDRSVANVERNGKTYEMNTANIGRRILASEIGEDNEPSSQTTTAVIDRSTGEVIEDAEIVKTTTKRETSRGSFDAGQDMLCALRAVSESITGIQGMKPKKSMAIEVAEAARSVISQLENLIASIEKGW